MTRLRPAIAAACLAVLLCAALSAPAAAQRDAQQFSAIADAPTTGVGFFESWFAWGRQALGWMQSIVAPEHGQIIPNPAVPPTP